MSATNHRSQHLISVLSLLVAAAALVVAVTVPEVRRFVGLDPEPHARSAGSDAGPDQPPVRTDPPSSGTAAWDSQFMDAMREVDRNGR
jgi:hypothetical protein